MQASIGHDVNNLQPVGMVTHLLDPRTRTLHAGTAPNTVYANECMCMFACTVLILNFVCQC